MEESNDQHISEDQKKEIHQKLLDSNFTQSKQTTDQQMTGTFGNHEGQQGDEFDELDNGEIKMRDQKQSVFKRKNKDLRITELKTVDKVPEKEKFGKREFDNEESSDEDPKNVFAQSYHKMYEFKPDQSQNIKGITLTSVVYEKDQKDVNIVTDNPFEKKE